MSRYKLLYGKGWHYDSYRHSLAAKGIKTRYNFKLREPSPRQLPIYKIGGKYYFRDERLGEYRNVKDPGDRISIDNVPNSALQKWSSLDQDAVFGKKSFQPKQEYLDLMRRQLELEEEKLKEAKEMAILKGYDEDIKEAERRAGEIERQEAELAKEEQKEEFLEGLEAQREEFALSKPPQIPPMTSVSVSSPVSVGRSVEGKAVEGKASKIGSGVEKKKSQEELISELSKTFDEGEELTVRKIKEGKNIRLDVGIGPIPGSENDLILQEALKAPNEYFVEKKKGNVTERIFEKHLPLAEE